MKTDELTPEQSIAIIRDMVAQTRKNLERGGGKDLLVFGYVSLFVTVAVYLLLIYTLNPLYSWGWFAIPVIGYPISYLAHRGEPKTGRVKTYIDIAVWRIWRVVGVGCMVVPFIMFFGVTGPVILPIEAMLLSIGVTLTGLTINFKALTAMGVVAGVITLLLFAFTGFEYQVPLFASLFLVAMIIPGHILNCKRCSKS